MLPCPKYRPTWTHFKVNRKAVWSCGAIVILYSVYILLYRLPTADSRIATVEVKADDIWLSDETERETVCGHKNLLLVIYVHSGATNYVNRALIRATWGNRARYPGSDIQVVFMLGMPPPGNHRQDVLNEQRLYQDMVLFPYIDTYANITQKAVGALEIISTNCRHVPYVLKTDDDVVVNMFSVLNFLGGDLYHRSGISPPPPPPHSASSVSDIPNRTFLLCKLWVHAKPFRDPGSKWYVSHTEYPDKHFPNYCSGTSWLMSIDTVIALSNASWTSGFAAIDDVFITGILAKQAGIHHIQMEHHFNIQATHLGLTGIGNSASSKKIIFFHASNPNVFQLIWNDLQNNEIPRLYVRGVN